MFFRAKCPIDTHEKTWAEYRMQFLADKLGIERLTSEPVVLPTEEFFPGTFRETMEEVEQFGEIIGNRLGLKTRPKFEFGDSKLVGVPARLVRDEATILIADNELQEPVHLISVMTHEMSRYLLLENNVLAEDKPDFDSVVDLLPVFCGMGVFSANATAQELTPEHLPRGGYLSSRVLGYALALFAWARGENEPTWAAHLRDDAGEVLMKSLKFLNKSNDNVFDPTAAPDKRRWSVSQSLERISAKSASQRLAALWFLKEHGDFSKPVSEAVQGCLRDGDVAVRRAAAALITKLEHPSADLQDDLLDAVRDSDPNVRAHAALAIGEKGFSGPDVELGLEPLLNDTNKTVLISTATTMARMGVNDPAVIEKLGKRFKTALVECNYDYAQLLAEPIGTMHGDIYEFARSYFAHDPELLEQAQTCLAEMNEVE